MATLKQRQAVKLITEKHYPISRAMREVGYDDTTAAKPKNLTNSKGFKELLAQMGVTDEKLAKVLNEGLEATKVIVMGKDSNEAFVDIQPDHPTRHKFLETGLRLRGYAKEEAPNFNINFINDIPRPRIDGSTSTNTKTKQETDNLPE